MQLDGCSGPLAASSEACHTVRIGWHAAVIVMVLLALAPAAHAHHASGRPMPIGDLPNWRQVFADDFATPVRRGGFARCSWPRDTSLMLARCKSLPATVGRRWAAYPDGWRDSTGRGTYRPSRVLSIAGGTLRFFLHASGTRRNVAAIMPKIPGGTGSDGGLPAGRYTMRFRTARLPRYKLASLLWPDNGQWPSAGEINFPEGDLDRTFSAFLHHTGARDGADQEAFPTHETFAAWHTATIEWTPGRCRFLLDGVQLGVITTRVPDSPMHWVIQAETAIGRPRPSRRTAGTLEIDWVAAYVPA